MMTGDAAVNPDTPIICSTAEILANLALREGRDAGVGQVVMDEFHYFADPDRGWAWQVPLLELLDTQHILLSATLGDVSRFAETCPSAPGDRWPWSPADRPVPLVHEYKEVPLTETLEELLGRAGTHLPRARHPGVRGRAGAVADEPQPVAPERRRTRSPRSAGSGTAPGSEDLARSSCATGSASTTRGCCPSTGGSWSG